MKKYVIHFSYILVITALAVFSRMKTNELEGQVEKCLEQAEELQEIAREAAAEAHAATQRAEIEAARAVQTEAETLAALKDCQGK